MTCHGYGRWTVNGAFPGALLAMPSTSGGFVPDAYTFYVAPNAAGQTGLPGGSGGACSHHGQQVGIAREQWNQGPNGGPGTCDWTTTTTDGARSWILTSAKSYVQRLDNGSMRGHVGDGDWARTRGSADPVTAWWGLRPPRWRLARARARHRRSACRGSRP